MTKPLISAAGAAAVLAWFLRLNSLQPAVPEQVVSESPHVSSGGEHTGGNASGGKDSGGKAGGGKDSGHGPWEATCRFAGKHPERAEDFCLDTKKEYRVQVLLAIVPNPMETRMALSTDRALESVERAASVVGWDFDSQWLPWPVSPDSSPPRDEVDRAARERMEAEIASQPGLLLFRASPSSGHPNDLLAALIADETPTAGVSQAQLANALRYAKQLVPGLNSLEVAGPTFSGSLPSLARFISHNALPGRYNILGGSASNSDYKDKAVFDGKHATFHSANHADKVTDKFLSQAIGVKWGETAVLAEDETGYGSSFSSSPKGAGPSLHIAFPREISALRNAYHEEQAAQSTKFPTTAAPALPTSLRDRESSGDSVPVFAQTHTPVSQNAVLNEIVRVLLARQIRLVQIAATNVLDRLFLARRLRESCPNIRLLLSGSDLTYVELAHDISLTGTLVVSTYPLFWPESEWSAPDRAHPLPFADDGAEALYVACRILLDPLGRTGPIPGYSMPTHEGSSTPPLWLMTVSPRGLWPVNLAASVSLSDPPDWMPSVPPSAELAGFTPPLESPAHRVLLTLCVLAFALLIALTVIALRAKNRTLYVLSLRPDVRFRAQRAIRLAVIYALFLALIVVLFAPWPGTDWAYRWRDWREVFFWLRAWSIASGVSPAVPVLLALAGLLTGLWCHLQRFVFAAERWSEFPGKTVTQYAVPALPSMLHDAERLLTRPASDASVSLTFWLAAGLGALAIWALHPLATVEPLWCEHVTDAILLLLFSYHAASVCLMLRLWNRLKNILEMINTLPLDGACTRLPKEYSAAPVWVINTRRRSYATADRSLYCLREISRLPGVPVNPDALESAVNVLRSAEGEDRSETYEDVAAVQRAACEAAEQLTREFLLPRWRAGTPDPDPHEACPGRCPDDGIPPPYHERVYRLAAEFVVLRYAAYIRYIMLQIRNLLFFASAGFVFLALALNSYPFEGSQNIARFVLLEFLGLGVAVFLTLAGMERDPVLSRMDNSSTASAVSYQFALRLATYGALPLLGVLAVQFPSIGRFLGSFVAPAIQAIK